MSIGYWKYQRTNKVFFCLMFKKSTNLKAPEISVVDRHSNIGNENLDPDPGNQTNADPCSSWSDFKDNKCWAFTWKIYFIKVIDHKTYLRRYKTLLERLEIRIISLLLDPPYQNGSGSRRAKSMRIHNTAWNRPCIHTFKKQRCIGNRPQLTVTLSNDKNTS